LTGARRKFHEIQLAESSSSTTEVLERIAQLYAIEGEVRGSPREMRLTVRQTQQNL
jgi:transposase